MRFVERLSTALFNLNKDIKTIRAFDHCPVVHPLFVYAFSNDPLSKTHRLALDIHGSKRRIVRFFYTVYWPVHAFHLATTAITDRESQRASTGLSRWELLCQMWWYMCRYNFTVESFFKYRLWESVNRRRAKEYIQHHEIIELLPWLNINKNVKDIDNKVCFEALCRKHGVPTPNILAKCSPAELVMEVEHLPKVDLFAKLDELWCGIGAQAWFFDKESESWKHDSFMLNEAELLQYLCESADEMPILLQPRFSNGNPLDTLSSGALCTFRIITFNVLVNRFRTLLLETVHI